MKKRLYLTALAALGFIVFLANAAHSQIVYVDIGNSSGTEDGTTWTTAYTNIQEAITLSTPPAEIWVAAGNYTYMSGSGVVEITNNFELYGGFFTGEMTH